MPACWREFCCWESDAESQQGKRRTVKRALHFAQFPLHGPLWSLEDGISGKSYQCAQNFRNFARTLVFTLATAAFADQNRIISGSRARFTRARRPPLSEDHSLAANESSRRVRALSPCVQALIFR
jgi:hypothetical protein